MSVPSESILSTTASQMENIPQLSRKFVARRISEGETGRLKEELKCQACGKGYKHVSSLAKHLWEHTPEWNVASKLLISKHQKVQLLEAASIIVSMNEEEKPDYSPEGFITEESSSPEDRTESNSQTPPQLSSPEPQPQPLGRNIGMATPRTIQKQRSRRLSITGSPAINSLVSVAASASPLADTWVRDEDFVRRRRRSTLVGIPDEQDERLPELEHNKELLEEDEEVFETEL